MQLRSSSFACLYLIKNSLIITDKRLILESNLVNDTSVGSQREEIAIDAIKGVQTGYSTEKLPNKSLGSGIICLLIGVVLTILSFVGVLPGAIMYVGIFLGVFLAILGLILIFKKTQSNMFFRLVILSNIFQTNAINISTIVNATISNSAVNITEVSPSLNLVFFDPKIAKDIVETIGELLLVD